MNRLAFPAKYSMQEGEEGSIRFLIACGQMQLPVALLCATSW